MCITVIIIIIIIRQHCSHSAAAYSRQTFPWTICRSVHRFVGALVGLSSALWKNGELDPDAVWHRRSDEAPNLPQKEMWLPVVFGGNLKEI